MTARLLWYLVKAIILLWMAAFLRTAVGATATATVTATITTPIHEINDLMISSMRLDMHGKTNDALTIANRSNQWRDVMVELTPPAGSIPECDIQYSPTTSSIPPGGHQVFRLLFLANREHPCTTEHQLLISDPQMPGVFIFSVSIHTVQAEIETGVVVD